MVLVFLGVFMLVFWLGFMLILLFFVKLGIFLLGGFDGFLSVIFLLIVFGVGLVVIVIRMIRLLMFEVIR